MKFYFRPYFALYLTLYLTTASSLIVGSLILPQAEAAGQENMLLRIAKSRPSDEIKDPEIASIGALAINDENLGFFDLINFQSELEGEIWGFDFGLGYPFSSKGSPLIIYLGFGLTLGYNTDQSDYILGYYPGAGLIYSVKQGVGITATANRYYNVYDDSTDAIMVGVVLNY